jgi:hypothetical protein
MRDGTASELIAEISIGPSDRTVNWKVGGVNIDWLTGSRFLGEDTALTWRIFGWITDSAPLVELVNKYAPNMAPTGIASYLFYDQEGLGLSPHIDTEIFTLNAILMLKHEYASLPPRTFFSFP